MLGAAHAAVPGKHHAEVRAQGEAPILRRLRRIRIARRRRGPLLAERYVEDDRAAVARLDGLHVRRVIRRRQRDGVRPRRHLERRRRARTALHRLAVEQHRRAGGRRCERQRAGAAAQRLELLRGFLAVVGGQRGRGEVALEEVGGLIRLVELRVALGDVPQLERRSAEAVRLLEIADGVVVATVAVGPRALLVERTGTREILGPRRARGGTRGGALRVRRSRGRQQRHQQRGRRENESDVSERPHGGDDYRTRQTPLTTRSIRAMSRSARTSVKPRSSSSFAVSGASPAPISRAIRPPSSR